MPRSAVIYTSPETFAGFGSSLRRKFEAHTIKPYTLSFVQKVDGAHIRVRVTELMDGSVMPMIAGLTSEGLMVSSSGVDKDVRNVAYDDLVEDADRARRVVTLQLASPVIVGLSGRQVPFPVFPFIFQEYTELWNAFSPALLPVGGEWLAGVHLTDFKISCVKTPFGPGGQGWVTLEMEKGRTEEEIASFNTLIDFAFYCGTGLHTVDGLGQTKKMVGSSLPRYSTA
jgi:hypothetical protein